MGIVVRLFTGAGRNGGVFDDEHAIRKILEQVLHLLFLLLLVFAFKPRIDRIFKHYIVDKRNDQDQIKNGKEATLCVRLSQTNVERSLEPDEQR